MGEKVRVQVWVAELAPHPQVSASFPGLVPSQGMYDN